ncbi:MAG: MFS transporter [Acidimicrobiales bacterium]
MRAGARNLQAESSTAPDRATLVLLALVLVAAVANLNLSVTAVALPDIARALQATQTELDLIAVGYSLGLAATVLYLGAVGDRYGRKLLLVLGVVLSVPACLIAATATTVPVLVAARIFGGVAAGMAYPTTLALITALWSGPARTRSIALWSALGGAISALGPVTAGFVLIHYYWGSVYLITLPLAVVALICAVMYVPNHVNETTEAVDNLGGVISMVFVGALVLAINYAAEPGRATLALELGVLAVAAAVGFAVRELKTKNPLFDLHVARRRIFWVAACAGIIVFGSLMAAMFVGQQFLQNVLGYSTFTSGAAILPAAGFMVVAAPFSAKMIARRGSRTTLLFGYLFCLLGFLVMLALWKDGVSYWPVGLGYALVGIGVGLAGTPASHSLTGSVPVRRAGMASGTADLQRDLGAAIMQSILGALLTAGYAAAIASHISSAPPAAQEQITAQVESTLQNSFAGAEVIAEQYPQYEEQIIDAARESFVKGADAAYLAGITATVLGAGLVFFCYPRREGEAALLANYHQEDQANA